MKFRIDFVTNSSSVSYIVSLHPSMAEFRRFKTNNYDGSVRKIKIYEALYNDITRHGTPMNVEGCDVITRRYDFEKKTACKYNASFGKPIEEVDFSTLSDDDLWAYIYGECLVNGKLSNEIRGFGSVQIPRDEKIFSKKRCKTVKCDNCERKGTVNCFKNNDEATLSQP